MGFTTYVGDAADKATAQVENALKNPSTEASHKMLSETLHAMSSASSPIQSKFLSELQHEDPNAINSLKQILPDLMIDNTKHSISFKAADSSPVSNQAGDSSGQTSSGAHADASHPTAMDHNIPDLDFGKLVAQNEPNPLGPEDVGDMIPGKNHDIQHLAMDVAHGVSHFFDVMMNGNTDAVMKQTSQPPGQ